MNIADKTRSEVIKWNALFSAITMVFLIVFFRVSIVIGFTIGFLASILNFQLLYIALSNAVKFTPTKAGIYTFITYIIRYSFWFFILRMAFVSEKINLVAVVAGLISIKLTIIVGNIFKLWNYNVDLIRKEED